MNDYRYSVSAIFTTPDAVMNAARKTSDAGYTKYDVHSPYPLHGMNNAMKLRPSKLGWVTLVCGLGGAAFALLFMYWATSIDYPLVVGGKPFFSFPALIPITFEVTVLSAAICTVAAMLIAIFRFPNNSHPLHDTEYMKLVSSDRYGISILATDPLFDEAKVNEFFGTLHAEKVFPIDYDRTELDHRNDIFAPRFVGLLVILFIVTAGATYFSLNKLLFMEPFTWMAKQPKLSAQDESQWFVNRAAMREPVTGTVSRGHIPYPFKGKPDAAIALVNPFLPTADIFARGKKSYLTFCSPCHGDFGKGDSRLRGQFPNPPTLHSEKVRQWKDGQIYHVITEGQNIMPPYTSLIPSDDRWAIVHYVRALQRAVNAKESDAK